MFYEFRNIKMVLKNINLDIKALHILFLLSIFDCSVSIKAKSGQ